VLGDFSQPQAVRRFLPLRLSIAQHRPATGKLLVDWSLGPKMLENQKIRAAQVMGPLGEPLTLESLPSQDTRHRVIRRKAEVVAAVGGGLLSIEEACERYDLSLDEFMLWRRAVERSGMY
jgi:hypothetical protein